MAFRKLSEEEIVQLEQQHCRSEDWLLLNVDDRFEPSCIRDVTFYGVCEIGAQSGMIEVYPGIKKPAGIYQSEIRNAAIGANVYINRVTNLANYKIETGVAIENVNKLIVSGETSFGNGIEIEVLNEAGGRELILLEKLSAQLAYLMVSYRQDPAFIKNLKALFRKEADAQKSQTGMIGTGARILNCETIENVKIGPSAVLMDALMLKDGAICSEPEAPVYIGEGVSANGFIIQSGSKVDGSAVLSKCFIGQAVQIGKQYSAENSAFFANCEGFHGEACSIFAGPYSVTHHKSTLLIAGLFSFFNAGSGTNQSNHMYKLGPVHQGIVERGAKTGSFCYLLWPSRVGAFSAVIGKHNVNFDGSDFPFSYINEEDGKSVLTPAMNLFTVGTRRDSTKWPNRDRRKSGTKHDLIHFDLLNPYTIGRILNGKTILQNLYENSNREKEWVQVKGLSIKRLLLKRCAKYYEMALKIFMGAQFLKMIDSAKSITQLKKFKSEIQKQTPPVSGEWVDMSGMIVPLEFVRTLMEDIKASRYATVFELSQALNAEFKFYDKKVQSYTLNLISVMYGKPFSELTKDELKQIVTDWADRSVKLNNMIMADAQKEFDSISQIGFGIDGDEEMIKADFTNVRGSYPENKFVLGLIGENEEIKSKSEKMKAFLDRLK